MKRWCKHQAAPDQPGGISRHGAAGVVAVDSDPLPQETSTPGVFAAGDVRHGSVKRVASAVGEGASAIQQVHLHLARS